jgi:spermidine synthase
MKSPTRKASPFNRTFYLASLLFAASGGTGLIYQVIWFKRFAHVWGSTSLAFAAVGASFLFGLGLGAYLIGRRADRAFSPLRWYGVCELAIGLWALVIPIEISTLVDASVRLYATIPDAPLLRFLMQVGITAVVVGPACVLMGGTLPLLVRQLTARDASMDQATGWLYGINTLGGAAGCYLAGFHLLPSLGLFWANHLTAAVNILIGLTAIVLSRSQVSESSAEKRKSSTPAARSIGWTPSPWGLKAATALAGCAALILEMTWSRQLALVLGGSTYAFTATLFVVLVGIALGSLIFHAFLRPVASSAQLPTMVIGILLLSILVGKLCLPWLSAQLGEADVRQLRGGQLGNGAVCLAACAAIELIPSVAMGILFPLFVHLTHAGAARVGRAVGDIYAWNTLGSIAGASLTAVLLFPAIGTAGALALAASFYLATLLAITPWNGRRNAFRLSTVAALGLAVIVWTALPGDPRWTNMGLYVYGFSPEIKAAQTVDSEGESLVTPVFFREGPSSNVLVCEAKDGGVTLRVNGKIDASVYADMLTQMGSAYLSRIFMPGAKEVAVIGFGSGTTPGKSLLFPGTHVTCFEIEPAVYEASPYFAQSNGRPHERTEPWREAHRAEAAAQGRSARQSKNDGAFSIVFGDGRTSIQGSERKYDLIISEPSNPWLAGVSNLFTREFFRTAREHLTDDGVLAQWVQAYNFTLEDYLMIVRTMRSEFPHCAMLALFFGQDTILLASKRPLMPSAENFAEVQAMVDASPEIRADMKQWFGTTDVRTLLALHYRLGQAHLDKLAAAAGSQAINTDLDLRLEFDAPLHLFRELSPAESASVMAKAPIDESWMRQLAQQMGMSEDSAEFYLLLAEAAIRQTSNPALGNTWRGGPLPDATTYVEIALQRDPKSAKAFHLLGVIRGLQSRHSDAVEALQKAVDLAPEDATIHAELAVRLISVKRGGDATAHLREALRLEPQLSADRGNLLWANNLAWILATDPDPRLRNGAEAVEWATKICELDGYKSLALLDTLAAAFAEAGRFDEAVRVSKRMLEMTANRPQVAKNIAARLQLYQSSRPYHE